MGEWISEWRARERKDTRKRKGDRHKYRMRGDRHKPRIIIPFDKSQVSLDAWHAFNDDVHPRTPAPPALPVNDFREGNSPIEVLRRAQLNASRREKPSPFFWCYRCDVYHWAPDDDRTALWLS